jgi:hypothetical protein
LSKEAKNRAIRIVGIVLIVASLIFIVRSFLTFDVEWQNIFSSKHLIYILIIVFTMMAIVAGSAYCWISTISFFSGKKVWFGTALDVYSSSNLGKYLPGNIGHYASRQLLGVSLGLKQSQLVLASILEIAYNAIGAGLLSVILAWDMLFALLDNLFPQVNSVQIILIGICAGLVVCLIIYFLFRKKSYFMELIPLMKTVRFWLLLLQGVFISATAQLLSGVLLSLLVGASSPISHSQMMLIISVSATSWLIGFITPGVPGGIGVRESALILMLASVCSTETILAAGVIQRVAFIMGDVMIWAVSRLWTRSSRKTNQILPPQ